MKATATIENLINGNLSDAKTQAKTKSAKSLIESAMGMGYNYNEALLMASFLKGLIDFQDYCDNMNNKY
jgi:hypothetical protein